MKFNTIGPSPPLEKCEIHKYFLNPKHPFFYPFHTNMKFLFLYSNNCQPNLMFHLLGSPTDWQYNGFREVLCILMNSFTNLSTLTNIKEKKLTCYGTIISLLIMMIIIIMKILLYLKFSTNNDILTMLSTNTNNSMCTVYMWNMHGRHLTIV